MLRLNPNLMCAFLATLTRKVNLIFKQLIVAVLMLLSGQNLVSAQIQMSPDLKVSLNGRTYPIGAQIVGSLGASHLIWGDGKTWKYGYLRGGLNLMTSAIVNRAGVEFQFFPISIAGVTFGYDTGVRNFLPKWLDCNVYECTGRVDRKHVRLNLVAAHAGVSFMMITKYEELRGFGSSKPIFDEITLLSGHRTDEHILTLNPALLYKLDEHTHVGVASLYSRSMDTGGYSHLYGPVVNLNPQPKMNALIGMGLNSSPLAHSAICGFFVLQYNLNPSMSVVDLALRNAIQDASESPRQ